MNFINLERSSSVSFVPNGVYKGNVVAVDEATNTVTITLPRVSGNVSRGPCKVLSATMPRVGDAVGCVFAENEATEVYVVGVIRNTTSDDFAPIIVCTSLTRPASPTTGTLIYETDTTLGYFWTGTAWVSVEGSEQDFGNVFFSADGLGIGAATASQPLSITQTSGTDYVSYNKSASAGLTNASAGAVIIGRATGPNVVVDSTTYAANNGTSASTALTGTVIQARDNGNPAALYLNPNGGDVRLETGGLVVNGDVTTLDGSSGRLEMPLDAAYIDSGTMASARISGSYPDLDVDGTQIVTGTVDFPRLGMAYPTASAPAASATVIGHQYYDTTTHELLVNSGSGYRKPWNMPWGAVGKATRISSFTWSGTSTADITDISLDWVAVAGRRYKTTLVAPIISITGLATAETTIGLFIEKFVSPSTYTRYGQQNINLPNGRENGGSVFAYQDNLSGSQTYKGRIVSTAGGNGAITGSSNVPIFLLIEDVGPVAGSTPPAGTFTLDSISMGILNQNVLG